MPIAGQKLLRLAATYQKVSDGTALSSHQALPKDPD
jgi:hypothetical protein